MALYDGFFDAVLNEETGRYDRAYDSEEFTGYFSEIIGSGVCVYENPDSFLVRFENGAAVVLPGYLFIQGYWLRNDADYAVPLSSAGTWAIVARLNLGTRSIELTAQPKADPEVYPDALVLAYVTIDYAGSGTVTDTRYNTELCGVIDALGELNDKVAYAINYIDNEIETKLEQAEQSIAAQAALLDSKIAEVSAEVEKLAPPPIGTIKFSASQNVGDGWLRCDGSFINEADYPELVAALGKLTPSGDKFQMLSEGEIPPQLSNGALYAGRMWVYSYSAKKLYGVDTEGKQTIKTVNLTSENQRFSDFIAPSVSKPICLSIVKHPNKSGAKLFLSQIINGGGNENNLSDYKWLQYCLLFQSEFSGEETSLNLAPPFKDIYVKNWGDYRGFDYYTFNSDIGIPYVSSNIETGVETYHMFAGYSYNTYGGNYESRSLTWVDGQEEPVTYNGYGGNVPAVSSSVSVGNQRAGYSHKNKDELVGILLRYNSSSSAHEDDLASYSVASSPNEIFSGSGNFSPNLATKPDSYSSVADIRQSFGPINVAGENAVVFSFDKDVFPYGMLSQTEGKSTKLTLKLPVAAKTFVDAAAYLWGKSIYLFFVGTGILFSRTLEASDFGYLDTTSVLGTITQFGYLDYSVDEGTLYIFGQDTTNKVKMAKIVLNTLYDYANDGAWLPMIASDGVPAYIKAIETEADTGGNTGPTVPAQIEIANNYSEYVSVLFNGERLISGTYTRMVSENGTFSIGLRMDEKMTGMKTYVLQMNGANVATIGEDISNIGSIVEERFKTQDYISKEISISVVIR